MKNKKWLRVALSFMAGLFLLLGTSMRGISQTDQSPTAAPEPVEYVIEDIQGTVQVLEQGSQTWESAEEGQVVDAGDEVKLGDNSEATLTMQSETSVHLGANTDMKVEQIAANETGGFLSRLQVLAGTLLADVKKHLDESHSTFEIESNGVVCGVRGTAFEVTANGDTAQVATHEGSVEVGNGKESHVVDAGNLSEFQKGKFHLQRRLEKNEIARFQKWRAFRQVVLKKRIQRLQEIRAHRRKEWIRRHPRLEKAAVKHELQKRKRRHMGR